MHKTDTKCKVIGQKVCQNPTPSEIEKLPNVLISNLCDYSVLRYLDLLIDGMNPLCQT